MSLGEASQVYIKTYRGYVESTGYADHPIYDAGEWHPIGSVTYSIWWGTRGSGTWEERGLWLQASIGCYQIDLDFGIDTYFNRSVFSEWRNGWNIYRTPNSRFFARSGENQTSEYDVLSELQAYCDSNGGIEPKPIEPKPNPVPASNMALIVVGGLGLLVLAIVLSGGRHGHR